MPYNPYNFDPNLAQFLYSAPQGVYNAFVQVDSGLYEVGAEVIVSATGGVTATPACVAPSGRHLFPDRPDVDAEGMR